MCYPLINTNIICKIDLITKVLIKAKNGPLIVIIKLNDLDNNKFILNDDNNIVNLSNNKILKQEDHVIVNIIAKNFYPNDERIIILGKLQDIAKKDEIDEYFNI